MLEREKVDVLMTDLRLGGEDGMELIESALKIPHPPVCIMMTAYGSVDTAVEAMKRGAYDFVTKPLNLDKVELLIARALQSQRMEQENRTLRQQMDEHFGLENILGESRHCEKYSIRFGRSRPLRRTFCWRAKAVREGTGGPRDS